MLFDFIKFPLWKNDHVPSISLNKTQNLMKEKFEEKIKSKIYKFVNNPCLCGNTDNTYDSVITEKDRFGIKCTSLLCGKCGLIRLKERLDGFSTESFYKNEYRALYVGEVLASDFFFKSQSKRGYDFLKLVSAHVDIKTIHNIFEVGCGAGGILYPFYQLGKEVSGCDFGVEYLNYGVDKGMNLYQGEVNQALTPYNSQDLIVLSHVMEHFNNPFETMAQLIEFVAPNKYLLVEVPGVFDIKKTYFDPLKYFQNAHVYNYYFAYLKVFFEELGLEVIYGDERCTFIVKKPVNWVKKQKYRISYSMLNQWPSKVILELKAQYLISRFKVNPYFYKKNIIRLLSFLRVKNVVKKAFNK